MIIISSPASIFGANLSTRLHTLLLKRICFLRYWNDRDVLKKLGEAMGFAVYGDAANAESSAADDSEEVGNDDESVVHQTASVGDAEVHDYSSQFFFIIKVHFIMFM